MAPIPTSVPSNFRAGTTVVFARSFGDYPTSDGWAYSLDLVGANTLHKMAVVDGTNFVLTLTATETAALSAGAYRYSERVTRGSEVYEVATGLIAVELNYATAANGAAQTAQEKLLAVVDALLAGRGVDCIESYQIAGRAVNKIPLQELRKWRQQLAVQVYRQAGGGLVSNASFVFSGN